MLGCCVLPVNVRIVLSLPQTWLSLTVKVDSGLARTKILAVSDDVHPLAEVPVAIHDVVPAVGHVKIPLPVVAGLPDTTVVVPKFQT